MGTLEYKYLKLNLTLQYSEKRKLIAYQMYYDCWTSQQLQVTSKRECSLRRHLRTLRCLIVLHHR
jgi:hypothetical protein